MVNIAPFRAYYYNATKVNNLGDVLTPPYDLISPEQEESLFASSPYNFIHLDFWRTLTSGNPQNKSYTEVKDTLDSWLEKGVFAHNSAPALYLHVQKFQLDGKDVERSDLFAFCEVTPYEEKQVLRHELTIKGTESDRLKHLEATQAYLNPIFGLYSDHEGFTTGYFNHLRHSPPLFQFEDKSGIQHTLWQDSNPKSIQKIQTWFKDRQIFLADGHHRYETALDYKKKHGNHLEHPVHDYTCIYLSNIYDPGLTILPYHRLLKPTVPLPDLPALREGLAPYFEIEPSSPKTIANDLLDTQQNLTVIGMEYQGQAFILKRPKGLPEDFVGDGESPSYRQLDVSVLHDLLLNQIIGFEKTWVKDPKYIQFSPDITQIQSWLTSGKGNMALYLNATAIQELCGVALAQEIMPPKSTYFYPKVPSGLLFSRFKDAL